ncbi:MAG: right-handed parallel beta-helix repeat-containing protein [Deltaproteobacteria bacterium]|nr:right-handed parallel beta-helix repeat-containing protein [Deltaproteobacteria bacterium]
MRRLALLNVLLLICVAVPNLAMAAAHYVRSGAAGNSSGTDWTNAWTALPSTLTRGDTYYIADGSYGSYTFNDAASGSTKIYVKKAIASDHGTDTGWLSSYGDGQAVFSATVYFTTSYWVFDGQTGSGKSGYGFKITTSGANKLLRFDNTPSYITVSRVEMQHRGINTESGDDIIYTLGAKYITVSRCYLHDAGRAPILLRGTTDSIFEYLYVARNWSTGTEHSEGISAYNGTHRNIVRHSVWEDITGTGVLMFDGDGWEIYGNVLFYTPGFTGSVGNGAIATWTGYSVTNAKVYNNTFVNLKGWNTGLSFDLGGSNKAYNNLWYNCERVKFGNVSHDYDWFYNSGTQSETHAQYGAGDPFVSSALYNYRLKSATAAGLALSSPYNIDMEGKVRGSDGVWDRGAYEYGVGSINNTTPSAPGGLTVN